MMKKSLLMMIAFALITIGAFAQRVGDAMQYAGSNYTVTAINGNTVTMDKVVAQGDGPVNWVAVSERGKIAYSSGGRSWTAVTPSTGADQSGFSGDANGDVIRAVAFGNNRFIAVVRTVEWRIAIGRGAKNSLKPITFVIKSKAIPIPAPCMCYTRP